MTMRKWIMRFTIIIIVLLLLKSHQGLIDSVSNFMIDGVVPFTDFAMGGALSIVTIFVGSLFIYKSIANLRFNMLKRQAVLYNQHQSQLQSLQPNTQLVKSKAAGQVEDLGLVQNSL